LRVSCEKRGRNFRAYLSSCVCFRRVSSGVLRGTSRGLSRSADAYVPMFHLYNQVSILPVSFSYMGMRCPEPQIDGLQGHQVHHPLEVSSVPNGIWNLRCFRTGDVERLGLLLYSNPAFYTFFSRPVDVLGRPPQHQPLRPGSNFLRLRVPSNLVFFSCPGPLAWSQL
jgi:hypothetical protein